MFEEILQGLEEQGQLNSFRHGKQHLASFLATLNILSLLFPTALERLDQKYAVLRAHLPTQKTFFEDLRVLTRYMYFDSWEHLLTFMLEGLEGEGRALTFLGNLWRGCLKRVAPGIVGRQETAKILNSAEIIRPYRYSFRPSLAFQTTSGGMGYGKGQSWKGLLAHLHPLTGD